MNNEWISALIMGLVEGLTEFLPVSSTGHLLLMKEILSFEGPKGDVFEIVIQLGAVLAVMAVYFERLWKVARNYTRDAQAQRFVHAVILAFTPAMALGAFAHGFIKSVLFNPIIVSVMFILGGIAILWIEKKAPKATTKSIETMSLKTALQIGLFQCIAMIPGVSRSGATIMGALLLKVERKVAAEFTFFLAIPTMAAAAGYDILKNASHLTLDDSELIAVGFVTAFVSALIVVRGFVNFVGKHGFAPFAYYRIAAGVIALIALLA